MTAVTKRTSLGVILLSAALAAPARSAAPTPDEPRTVDVAQEALDNEDFRRVLATGRRMQLVVMSLPPGGRIGLESHAHVEQFLVCVRGRGEAVLDGRVVPFEAGRAILVPAGTRHDLRNVGDEPLKLYTVYAPPNHLPDTVHHTRRDAEADAADEAFGRQVR